MEIQYYYREMGDMSIFQRVKILNINEAIMDSIIVDNNFISYCWNEHIASTPILPYIAHAYKIIDEQTFNRMVWEIFNGN